MNTAQYRPSDLLRGRAIPDSLLAALPKTDLHSHLDGCLRLETFRELGRAEGMEMPDDDEALRGMYFPADRECRVLEFLRYFDHTLAVLQTPENLERVAYELAMDFFAHGVWCLEVRFCPLLHNRQGMTPDGAVAAVQNGLRRAERETGIRVGIIVTGLRTIDPSRSLELARLAVAWKARGVVAFDLAGEEMDHPAKKHQPAFYHLLNNNQNITIHAGEGFGPASIHQALHRCGANRIGHGTRLEEDPDLMAYVADHRVPLEICLSSNLQSCVVEDLRLHPFRYYLRSGLRVCLNCDNTLFARTDPVRELRLAVDTFDLTLLETEHLLLNGFKSAFLPEKDKGDMVQLALKTMTRLRDEHGVDGLMPTPDGG
ncbi:adenosine deaminase [bacterium DOLJORAL78_65_58]|nr:MAG: adenosine deaminase [bacterium DOLZORAL124_64_63]PIE76776.1 MAG: adenosine deaminase [bacterium DOLJORAL78_65_58]